MPGAPAATGHVTAGAQVMLAAQLLLQDPLAYPRLLYGHIPPYSNVYGHVLPSYSHVPSHKTRYGSYRGSAVKAGRMP